MDNLRRLSAAWLLYADDSGGKLVGNYHGGFVPEPDARERPWATGWLDWDIRTDNTNTTYLTEPRYAALAPYLGGDPTVYKCPSDNCLSPKQAAQGWSARVRSYSLNCLLGQGNQDLGPLNPNYWLSRSLSDFGRVSPGQIFTFLDEHPDSLNDGLFWIPNSNGNWVDFPGSLHDGAAWFSYADGHVALRRWNSPPTVQPVSFSNRNNVSVPANDPDLLWVLERAGEPRF